MRVYRTKPQVKQAISGWEDKGAGKFGFRRLLPAVLCLVLILGQVGGFSLGGEVSAQSPGLFTIEGNNQTDIVNAVPNTIEFTVKSAQPGLKIQGVTAYVSSNSSEFPLKGEPAKELKVEQGQNDAEATIKYGPFKPVANAKSGIYFIRFDIKYQIEGQSPQGGTEPVYHKLKIGDSNQIKYIPPGHPDYLPGGPADPPSGGDSGQTPPAGDKELPPPVNRKSMLMIKDGVVPRLELGQEFNLQLPIVNRGDQYVRIVNITPTTPLDDSYPFEILQSDYTKQVECLLAPQGLLGRHPYGVGTEASIDFGKMYVKSDLKKGYYKVDFNIKYQDFMTKIGDYAFFDDNFRILAGNGSGSGYVVTLPEDFSEITLSLIFYVNGVGDEKPDDEAKIPTPRLLTTGFTTNPDKVVGGDEFSVRIMLRNASQVTNVQNVRLSFDSGDKVPFLPTDGASIKYIDNIPAGGEYEVVLNFKSMANLEENIYPLNLNFEYEDYKSASYQANETLSIPIHQETRIALGRMEIYPEMPKVGDEVNLIFDLLNKGKTKLNNASLIIPAGGPLEENEVFLGNIDPGTTKNIDINVMPLSETMPGDKIKLQIKYEDSNGKEQVSDQEFELTIMPAEEFDPGEFPEEPFPDDMGEDLGEGGFKMPVWAWILIVVALLIGGIAGLTTFLRRRKRRLQAEEDAEFFRQLEEEQKSQQKRR